MKKALIPAALISIVILSAAAAKKGNDPVLMTVNGKDVRLSEFEYLYNKNERQQAEPQTMDEYLDIFVNYKLKVADAEAAGIDTTAAFTKEFHGYCLDAAKPYMRDSLVEKRIIQEAYDRLGTLRDISHIMLPLGQNPADREASRQRLDSIRNVILAGADFGEMAVEFSSDPSAKRNQGHMGFIQANSYPYPFEKAAYETAIGEISEVVEDAPYGFHIVKVNGEKPNPGQVHASHILKMTRGLNPAEAAKKKAEIDSIYNVLMAGADFAEVAKVESDDKGSGGKGGDLGFFGMGRMVKPFEETAFAMSEGEISKPFQTDFGYHIIKLIAKKPVGTLEEEKAGILRSIGNDSRAIQPEKERLEQFKQMYKAQLVEKGIEKVQNELKGAEGDDPYAAIRGDKTVVAQMGKNKYTAAEVSSIIKPGMKGDPAAIFKMATERYLDGKVREEALANLEKTDPEFASLVHEYHDGILMFEISNRNVWNRSTTDVEGLKKFFEENRAQYNWNDGKKRFKGYVVFATNDSIAREARQYLASSKIENDSLVPAMKAKFGRNIKVEHVLASQGENAIIDNVAFGGEKPEAPGSWKEWFAYGSRIIEQPEEAADLKGAVTSDYQQVLEKEWVEELHKKYPVKYNEKEIKKLKH